VSSDQAGSLVILDTMTGYSGFSFSLGIFMFFLMFLFSSWVHGVFYRFHALKIPTSSFHHRIMDVDGQSGILLGFFSKKASSKVKLNTYLFFMVATMDIYFIIFNGSYNLGLAPS
jgi:hypothetical protein